MGNNNYSHKVNVFHNSALPEAGKLVGYAALIAAHELIVPLPDYR
jgi:hypothetical protein